jgi:glycosyltransferase involved in cell wall biosynthesis
MRDSVPRRKFVFISSNFTWGGSEILWSGAAEALARAGHHVAVYKNRLPRGEGNVPALRAAGCRLFELARFPFLPNKLYSFVAMFTPYLSVAYQALRLHVSLKLRRRPDLVVLSQGGNHDGWLLGGVCRRLGVPYVLICQKATDLYWPQDRWRDEVRAIYAGALHAFFVSEHNWRLTEEQIGARIDRASVARNPFLVPWDHAPAWPDSDAGFRFASVGRLYPKEKGQDIILRVLASEKWRGRPVSLTVYGDGEQRQGLEAMAKLLGLTNVAFAGYAEDVAAIWAKHHALLLPSRAEGLPLVVVEAMLCGRVPVVTDVGGNKEVVDDGRTGFIAAAAAEGSFDEAMERAWQRRNEWPDIGAAAAEEIRRLVPSDPPGTLAEALLRLAGEAPPPSAAAS